MKHLAVILCLFLWSPMGKGQDHFKNILEFDLGIGTTNDMSGNKTYNLFNSMEDLVNTNRRSPWVINMALGFSHFISSNNGIKFTFGFNHYGFDYSGQLSASNTLINGSFRTRFLEIGMSFFRRTRLSKMTQLIIESGFRYHSDPSFQSDGLLFSFQESISLSNYLGVEIPMSGYNYFTNAGIQVKLPLRRYNFDSIPPLSPSYYPYFIGLKIGLDFQFNFKKRKITQNEDVIILTE